MEEKLVAPDKEKILSYADELDKITPPMVKTKEAIDLVIKARNTVNEVIGNLIEEVDKLGGKNG